jgi:hypothetical protein
MKSMVVVLGLLGIAFVTGCSDPCGDIKDCCNAVIAASTWPAGSEAAKAAAQATCDAYDNADKDACQAAKDNYHATPGVAVPDECDF